MTVQDLARSATPKAAWNGGPKLTLARLIVKTENILLVFARPLMLAGFFVALAWLGVFASLYPWAHLAACIVFTLVFFEALGRAHAGWKPATESEARRRVEESSGLSHRPLDVVGDRPVTPGTDQIALWQAHTRQAKAKLDRLRWPAWKPDFAARDPHGARYALLALLTVGMVVGWGMLGGRVLQAINPAIGRLVLAKPALDAWITPPAYTHMAPIMIVTPAGARFADQVIDVPEGSVISAHLAGQDGSAPSLEIDGHSADFAVDAHQDYSAVASVTGGSRISISRGWMTLGSWRIRVVPDKAPQVAFTDHPSASARKSVRVPFEATDDYGVRKVGLLVTPHASLPGISADPIEIPLASPDARNALRTAYVDLTAHPWAGLPVTMQLVATDEGGHSARSEPVDLTLPEREFYNPLAVALADERRKLLQNPADDGVRDEVANVMAGIAQKPKSYRGDPLVLLALRAGAVRLVLEHDMAASLSVDDMLWQTALRIEDGNASSAEQLLREAQNDLADALDGNASDADVQKIIDRLHQALARYLSELSSRMAGQANPLEGLAPQGDMKTNMMTPDDLMRMLDGMRDLSAEGSRDAARQELARLQQFLENLRTGPVQLSAEQRAILQRLKDLRKLEEDQKQLADRTFRDMQAASGGKGGNGRALAAEQNALLKRLREMMQGADGEGMAAGAEAMRRAAGDLGSGLSRTAGEHQGEAIRALQQAEQALQDDIGRNMFQIPGAGFAGADPFGNGYNGRVNFGSNVKVPDRMQSRHVREILDELQRRAGDMGRPKTERDYIERLLQNF